MSIIIIIIIDQAIFFFFFGRGEKIACWSQVNLPPFQNNIYKIKP